MTRAITAAQLKARLGRVLKSVQDKERFLILRRNTPIGVLMSIHEYVKNRPDEYEDVQDFLDTFMEENDPEFQRSLRNSQEDYKAGRFLTHKQLKVRLAGKKFS